MYKVCKFPNCKTILNGYNKTKYCYIHQRFLRNLEHGCYCKIKEKIRIGKFRFCKPCLQIAASRWRKLDKIVGG